MKGLPKHMNSKYDYLYIKETLPDDEWKPYWRALLTESKTWVDLGEINESEAVTDNAHKIEHFTEKNNDGTEKATVHQYELRTDMSSDMIRLGFTAAEVRTALGEAVQ